MDNVKLDVKIAFYKAHRGNWADKLIGWWTKGYYSHCELVVGDKWIYANTKGIGINRLRPLDETKWDFKEIKVELTPKQYVDFWQYVHKLEGTRYDWLGIVTSQIIKFGVHDDSKWFCSELVTKLLSILGEERCWQVRPEDVSPNDLARLYKVMV